VAIKVLDLDSSEDEFEEIQKEINVLINCDSEYITRYHSSYLVQTNLWIVMDYAYTSIRQILKSGSLTERSLSSVKLAD
jgi:serine/threonine-protein kinase 24/25/MST4